MQRSLDDRLVIKLDTTKPMEAEKSLALALALVAQLRSYPGAATARIVIERLGEGSWYIHLLVILGAVGAIADRVPKLVADIRAGEGPFGMIVGRTLDEHVGESCQVVSEKTDEVITRNQITTNPIGHDLHATATATGRPELGQPTLSQTPTESDNEEPVSGQSFMLKGEFTERLANGNYVFQSGPNRNFEVEIRPSLKPILQEAVYISGLTEVLGDGRERMIVYVITEQDFP